MTHDSSSRAIAPILMCGLLALVPAAGCGNDAPAAPPPVPGAVPAAPGIVAPAAPVAPAPVAAGAINMSAANGVVYRWSDGDWVARVTVTATAGGSALAVARSGFLAEGFNQWSRGSNFPSGRILPAGQAASGDVAFYIRRTNPAPTSITINYANWSQTVPLVAVAAPPPHATPVPTFTGGLAVTLTGGGQTWRWPSDQTHIVRVPVSVNNTSNVPLTLPTSYWKGTLGTATGRYWRQTATLNDDTVIQPGGTFTGFVSWYFPSSAPVPTSIQMMVGPEQQPYLAQQAVAVAAIPAPQ